MYVSNSEGAKFGLGVLTDLQSRGVKHILIPCVDGLIGFPDAIQNVFLRQMSSCELCTRFALP